MRAVALLALVLVGCGSASPVGPTVPAVGLDPAYVKMITVQDAAGHTRRWEGGAFHHCFAPELASHQAHLEAVVARISALSGVPQTNSGPCNVEWVVGPVPGEVRPAFSVLGGTETAIFHVTVRFQDASIFESRPGAVLHEGGHVLGLWHSTVPTDLMNPDVIDGDFSANELAVLAWMYGK